MDFIQSVLQSILDAINSVPSYAWEVLIESVVLGVITSGAFVGVKKWFSIDSEKKMICLVLFGSMFLGALAYLQSVPYFAPWFAVVQGALIFTVSQPAYRLLIKPIFARIGAEIQKAVLLNEEIKSAKLPAGGLTPVTTDGISETVEIQEFNS